jgi:hypothetical protein
MEKDVNPGFFEKKWEYRLGIWAAEWGWARGDKKRGGALPPSPLYRFGLIRIPAGFFSFGYQKTLETVGNREACPQKVAFGLGMDAGGFLQETLEGFVEVSGFAADHAGLFNVRILKDRINGNPSEVKACANGVGLFVRIRPHGIQGVVGNGSGVIEVTATQGDKVVHDIFGTKAKLAGVFPATI